jgi:S1-C subfamily serine protease
MSRVIDVPREIVAPYVLPMKVTIKKLKVFNITVGTGFYVRYKNNFYIMTNKHVCNIVGKFNLNNGKIQFGEKKYKILKMWDKHDLCLVESDRKRGLKVALDAPSPLDRIYLVGHPRGLDLIIREGRIVGPYIVNFGKGTLPVQGVQISALAYGGNSGSPVTNIYGEVIGVLFAGDSRYPNEPYIVPYRYIIQFLEEYISE